MGSETRILGGGRLTVVLVLLLSTSIIGIQSINSQHYYDTDLVFDDSSTLPSKAVNPAGKPNTDSNLVNEGDERLFDLGADNVVVSDDDIEAAEDDEDETPEEEEEAYENDEMRAIAAAPQDESQNWLVRSVHRIKRSIDNLLSGNDKATTKKPKKRKNPKKMVNGSKKVRDSDLIAGKKIGRNNPKSNEEKKSEKPKNVHRSQTGKRRGHEEALRLKRQFDGLADDEDTLSGSGGPLEIESENAYKLTLTVLKPWRQALADKESQAWSQVAKEVAGNLHNLLSRLDDEANFIITVLKLERNPDSAGETFITFEINVDKHSINRQTIDNALRTSIEQGYGQFDMKGYSLISEGILDEDYTDTDYPFAVDKPTDTDYESERPFISERPYTVSSVDHNEDDDDNIIVETETQPELPPSTHKNDPTEDLCRGDDKVRCGKTNVFICDVQRCDGQPDCPNGEDEDPANCPENARDCSDDEFSCDQERCIPKSKQCDNHHDCDDGTDEIDCPTQAPQTRDCLQDEFTCPDGSCIPSEQRCDGQHDCEHGEDEENCPNSCNSYEFTCENGECIDKHDECNGVRDCRDGSDERNCPSRRCNDDEFACNDGSCVHQNNQCNGRDDCPDGSDEHNCHFDDGEEDEDSCTDDEFFCDGRCLDKRLQCDGRIDCQSGEDEENCPDSNDCSESEFACDEKCVDKDGYCDGLADCADGTDENNCIICQAGAFHCKSRECIPSSKRCDGTVDCTDSSDELDCNTNSSNGTSGACNSDQWQCDNGICINSEFRCDAQIDCADRSDEMNCPPGQRCTVDEFTCDDGTCIDIDRQCDRRPDCADGSDERNCDHYYPPAERCPQHECPDGTCIEHSQRCDGRRDCRDGSDEQNCPCRQNQLTCNEDQCMTKKIIRKRNTRLSGSIRRAKLYLLKGGIPVQHR
uniref:Putative low-density lipoprotein receptor n=1 Tax=Culex tarsalis TaxID=7177 RepID=A0A1Q3FKU3_CULTA